MTNSLTELKHQTLTVPSDGLRLSSGEFLTEVVVAYETYGTLAEDKKNVIYICHALTGDSHAAFRYSPDDPEPGWWDPIIGPGKAIDTDKFFVVCSNILGGCKGTTGPNSIDPASGKPYGAKFPLVTIKDVVCVQKMLLDQLGIPELYCVIGGSMGGMQSLEWSISYPDYVRKCICIASAVSLSPQALAFDIIGRQEIEFDPHWNDGDYYDNADKPAKGLSRARQIGHVTYLSSAAMENKFGREQKEGNDSIRSGKFSTSFQVESYLNYQGNKFVKRFDANAYLYISRMMDMFDLAKEHGSVKDAFRDTQCEFLIVSISTDWLFPPSQQLEIVSSLLSNRKPVSYFNLDSQYGHDAFLIEYDDLGPGIQAFLNGKVDQGAQDSGDRMDLDHICAMIKDGSHILDVGSGGGELMYALKEMKNISGICLDVEFEKIVECMGKGLSSIQLDADTGLGIIEDNSFDCVLLNQTIQQLKSALQTIKQIIRIAGYGVVGFPNFAYYKYRLSLFLRGKLPVSGGLPFEWYNTPNTHLVTVTDFKELCRRHDIRIEEIECLADDVLGKLLISMGFENLGSDRGLVAISRQRIKA